MQPARWLLAFLCVVILVVLSFSTPLVLTLMETRRVKEENIGKLSFRLLLVGFPATYSLSLRAYTPHHYTQASFSKRCSHV